MDVTYNGDSNNNPANDQGGTAEQTVVSSAHHPSAPRPTLTT